jgi:hypothetical protein
VGFTKKENPPEISIEVRHPWHPGSVFIFHFPKKLHQLALDAEQRFLGLTDDARPDEHRKAIIDTIAEMVIREPEGFDDFPDVNHVVKPGDGKRPLAPRMREYFDDDSQPELETIIVSAWRAYRAAAVPTAYVKSLQSDGEGAGHVSGLPQKT